jgi:hypothetical protein
MNETGTTVWWASEIVVSLIYFGSWILILGLLLWAANDPGKRPLK